MKTVPTSIESILLDNGFTPCFDVSSRHSISDLIGNKMRCGIYVLQFSDYTFYVGQAVDVCRRFLQHKKNYDDMEFLYFKNELKENLNSYELYMIRLLEGYVSLRNISYASLPELACSELDQLIDEEDQGKWILGHSPKITQKRVEDKKLRRKTAKRAEKMILDQKFSEYILPVMKKYIRRCIIEPYLTELTYWGCSCLNTMSKNAILYSRINLRFQEVFTTGFDIKERAPFYIWHVAKSPFGDGFDIGNGRIGFDNHYYPTGGKDQFTIYAEKFDDAMDLLDNETFLYAAKLFNLSCMRKGAQPYAKTHCPTLADYLFAD